jgi:hypothetical protein
VYQQERSIVDIVHRVRIEAPMAEIEDAIAMPAGAAG